MKWILRTLIVLMVTGFATAATAQTTTTSKAPKAAKAKKHKGKRSDAVTAPIAPTPAPTTAVAPTPAPAPTAADGTVIDPTTGQAIPEKLTTISFPEVNFDFGKIKEGDVVKHKFVFTNSGTNDLILENVKPSCGCTALEWPRDPIAPGKSGVIEAQFNSAGKSGPQMKTITITLNSVERLERLSFTGEVIPKVVEGIDPTPDGQ